LEEEFLLIMQLKNQWSTGMGAAFKIKVTSYQDLKIREKELRKLKR
jgi:2-C-methyl-D-erythritol 4-phosphate cytidylyltransferase